VKVYGKKGNGNSMEHNKITLHKFKSKSNFSFGTRGNMGHEQGEVRVACMRFELCPNELVG
jgi:hypothetical protein